MIKALTNTISLLWLYSSVLAIEISCHIWSQFYYNLHCLLGSKHQKIFSVSKVVTYFHYSQVPSTRRQWVESWNLSSEVDLSLQWGWLLLRSMWGWYNDHWSLITRRGKQIFAIKWYANHRSIRKVTFLSQFLWQESGLHGWSSFAISISRKEGGKSCRFWLTSPQNNHMGSLKVLIQFRVIEQCQLHVRTVSEKLQRDSGWFE